MSPSVSPSNGASDDPNAAHFAQVSSGIYRRIVPQSVWLALSYAVRHRLAAENPTIMMMFVRIAEVYPEVRQYLQQQLASADRSQRTALDLIFNPPPGIRDAEYLPDQIQSPGEMDLCWSEFLVTGSVDPITKVVQVLDREDMSRRLIDTWIVDDDPSGIAFDEEEMNQLANVGIALGRKAVAGDDASDAPWQIMSPGDVDVLLWFGVKDKVPACMRIFDHMDDEQRLHLAVKGAAMWSLRANAAQHGKIRLFCEQQSKLPGGSARQLIDS